MSPDHLAAMRVSPIRNAMTIDVEDYFQVSAFAPHIARDSWPSLACRVEANMDRILGLLDSAGIKATFFTLGWIAERYPAMVRRVVEQGHELASHGYGHQRASDLGALEFKDDIVRSKALLEQIGGQAVLGYRAPSFSIGTANLWTATSLLAAAATSAFSLMRFHAGLCSGSISATASPRSSISTRGNSTPASRDSKISG
jgi:polysaccharide deacetylase family protein (PEP-CTERM system associated)